MLFNTTGRTENEEISLEAQSLILECALQDELTSEEMEAFLESHTDVNIAQGEEILLEKSIVRLDKKAKLSKAQKMAVFTIAKEKNDPKFKKLLTVWRMERFLEGYLDKKYGNEALRRAKKSVNKAAASKSTVIKKAANNVAKQLNMKK